MGRFPGSARPRFCGVGNAPCSWGTLEFEGLGGGEVPWNRMLDELAETGYTGTELGDWGYLPAEAGALRRELSRRGLAMLGAFVPVDFRREARHAQGLETALRTARLLAAVSGTPPPFLVLADANGSDPVRTGNAGRVEPEMGLSAQEWKVFARGVEGIAAAVRRQAGLATVFHHHCAGFVETPDEIRRLLSLTSPELVGLAFDTGHFVYGSGGLPAPEGLEMFGGRVWYVHFKDCHPEVAARARKLGWDYFQAVRRGVFCELGQGSVDFASVADWLASRGYGHYLLVEQDVLPGMGAPRESARRNREYLRTLGI
jgi:inosose dehydratase